LFQETDWQRQVRGCQLVGRGSTKTVLVILIGSIRKGTGGFFGIK